MGRILGHGPDNIYYFVVVPFYNPSSWLSIDMKYFRYVSCDLVLDGDLLATCAYEFLNSAGEDNTPDDAVLGAPASQDLDGLHSGNMNKLLHSYSCCLHIRLHFRYH